MGTKKAAWPRRFEDLKKQALYDRELAINTFTEAVITAMQEQNLSKAEVARRLGISRPAVSQMLDGPNFTFGTAAQLALAVGLRFVADCCDDDLAVFNADCHSFEHNNAEAAQEAVSSNAHPAWTFGEAACFAFPATTEFD